MGLIWQIMAHTWLEHHTGCIWCPVLWNFKLWEEHRIESLRKDFYSKTMGRSCLYIFHSNGSSASLSFSLGMIWDHHTVWNNYGNQVPIGIPYQVLKHTSLALPALRQWCGIIQLQRITAGVGCPYLYHTSS